MVTLRQSVKEAANGRITTGKPVPVQPLRLTSRRAVWLGFTAGVATTFTAANNAQAYGGQKQLAAMDASNDGSKLGKPGTTRGCWRPWGMPSTVP
jgi:hypothetical protein